MYRPPDWLTELEDETMASIPAPNKHGIGWNAPGVHPEARPDVRPTYCPQCRHGWHGHTCQHVTARGSDRIDCGCPGIPVD